MRDQVQIEGMHCASCVDRIRASLKEHPEITHAEVTLDPPVARFESNRSLGSREISQILRAAGDYQVAESGSVVVPTAAKEGRLAAYYPLLLVVSFVGLGTALLAAREPDWSTTRAMRDFMGLFFLAFGFFKLLDVAAFASAFARYDLLAERSRPYGLAYPFIEVALGIGFLLNQFPRVLAAITATLMLFGLVGIIRALQQRTQIQCACLGTVFELPMTVVTVIENGLMSVMALAMLLS